MGILNLLAEHSTNYIDFAVEAIDPVKLKFIGKIIQGLIEGVGIIGIGIILFTIILKTIVLPLDIYSRYKMKKQSLLMKAMRPQMEKLQKQYANDKQMYNQKVMELQKANGISMFSACIPMIVSLVIFMVVFSSFSTYSQYANLQSYNGMVNAYNASVETFVLKEEDSEEIINENGFLIRTTDEALGTEAYFVDFDRFISATANHYTQEQIDSFNADSEAGKIATVREYVRDSAGRAAADYYRSGSKGQSKVLTILKGKNGNGFLWVKNIWYPDSMLNREVPNFSKFSSSISRATGSGISAYYAESYDAVTHYLRYEGANPGAKPEGQQYNGYFVLIVAAIGLMFLQQFISMRTQKDNNELSTVDGSASKTNKYMMFLMPVIYGVFSFFYSAAFSIYMITNTVYGLITTVVLNKIMDVRFAKLEASGELFKKKNKAKTINRKRLK